MKRYDEMPHTADLAARIYGKDLAGLFANAAFAMFDMMRQPSASSGGLGTPSDISSSVVSFQPSAKVEVKVEVEAPDEESLLISFLNEILYISYIKKAFFTEFSFAEFAENKLKAVISGHLKGDERPKHEIKAATYHDVKIKKTKDGYETTVVFDI